MSEIDADKESHFSKWERVIKATKFEKPEQLDRDHLSDLIAERDDALDALEKSREGIKTRDEWADLVRQNHDLTCERDAARLACDAVHCELADVSTERDAVRALLGEALPWVGHMSDNPDIGLRARIAAELEPKP